MRTRPLTVIVCTVLFVVLLLMLHILDTSVDPISQFTSEYGYGRFGWLATVAFISQGIGFIILGLQLREMEDDYKSKIGIIFIYATAAAMLIFGIFPMDAMPPTTLSGNIHFFTGPLFYIVCGLFPLLMTLKLRKAPVFQGIAQPMFILSIVILVWTVIVFGILGTGMYSVVGLIQRIFMLLWVIWTIMVSTVLAKES